MNLETMDRANIERVHAASLTVLESVGVRVMDEGVCRILKGAGAQVDESDWRVRMPSRLVLEALKMAPSEVRLYDRRGGSLLLAEGQRPYHCSTDLNWVVDFRTSKIRRIQLKDIGEITRLGDFLPAIGGVAHQGLAEDVPSDQSSLRSIESVVLNTTKHCLGAVISLREAELWTEMADVLLGDIGDLRQTPIISFGVSTTSPLQFDKESVNVLVHAARHGIPVRTIPCPLSGATTPMTLAGTLVVQNAEALFTIALAQLVKEHAPMIYGGIPGIMDMKTGAALFGTPEFSLMSNTVAQLARFYGLPCYTALGDTDAIDIDVQSGVEKLLSYLTGYISGINLSVGASGLATASVSSYEQLVIDNEILEIVERYMRGIQVDADTLALQVIEKVGPGGNYLVEDHTLAWLKKGEHYYPRVFNRQAKEVVGTASMVCTKAHEQAARILADHAPAIPADVSKRVKSYVQDKARDLAVS